MYDIIGSEEARKLLPVIPVTGDLNALQLSEKSELPLSTVYRLLGIFRELGIVKISRFDIDFTRRTACYTRLITVLNVAISIDGHETSRDLLR